MALFTGTSLLWKSMATMSFTTVSEQILVCSTSGSKWYPQFFLKCWQNLAIRKVMGDGCVCVGGGTCSNFQFAVIFFFTQCLCRIFFVDEIGIFSSPFLFMNIFSRLNLA